MADQDIPQSHEIVTRAEAKRRGLKRYFTGKPCKAARHLAERITSTGFCLECRRAWDRHWSRKNQDKVRAKARRRWEANKEDMMAKRRAWGRANPNANRRYCKDKYWRDPEKARSVRKKWRAKNAQRHRDAEKRRHALKPQIGRARSKAWKLANQERVRASSSLYAARRRSVLKKIEGRHSAEDLKRIFKEQNGKCAYCRVSIRSGYHIDHIIAITRGGTNWPSNIQLCCRSCNEKKGAKDPSEFARSLGRLI